jgi:Carboxypeptidase regulatory-like domain/TonB dependent receptor
MNSYKQKLLAFFLWFCCPMICFSQTGLTSLRGVVRDPSGALVPQAQVSLTEPEVGFSQERTTNDHGSYVFEQIPPGHYLVKVTSNQFAPQKQTIDLLVNQPATLDFTMSLSTSTTIVQVTSALPTLNTTDATIGTPFNSQQIQSLPFEGNNVLDLLSLQAGVLFLGDQNTDTQNTDSRSGAVNGARSDQSNVTLDGLDNNNQTAGYAFQGILRSTRDSVEEFRVVTTNSNADSGRSSGAQVSLVTRSGTNKLHGSAYEYYRPTNTVANDWFLKHAELSSGQPNIPGKLLRNTYGASLGGPIEKDKLFFFAAYEGQKTAENSQVTREVPTESFKQGLLTYDTASGPQTLGPADLAKMDPKCSSSGACPLGPGVDPAALAYFAKYPKANGSAIGDGYNLASYTFSSPSPASLTTLLVKLDYNMSNRHRMFVRGNLQDDNTLAPLQFPGSIPNNQVYDNTKGIGGGLVSTFTDSLINNLRYGFIRQGYANRGSTNSNYVTFNSIDALQSTSNTSQIVNVPVHNVVDDVTWIKGNHTFQFGGNYRAIFNNRQSDTTQYNHANVTYSYLTIGSIANQGTSLDPAAFGYPAASQAHAYNVAVADIAGLITHASQYYNYSVNGNSLLPNPPGQWTSRHYFDNEVEYYFQDSWKLKPNLTITVGLRHSLLQVPYERNGQEVAPTISLGQWFSTRAQDSARGITTQPSISFGPAGKANGKPGLWNMDKADLAPRFAFAYSPNSHTSIRGGWGLYYDHFGQGIVNSFDQRGAFGLATLASNGVNQDVDTAPRYAGQTSIPTSIIPAVTSSGQFPVTPGNDLAIYWGVDSKVRTPYSHVFDLSVQQEITPGFSFELSYTGRLGRRLLQTLDLAAPLDLVDPKSGTDYFSAATQLSKYVDEGRTAAQVPAIAYWEDMFPLAAGNGFSATQNIYQDQWSQFRGNETAGLYDLDLGFYPGSNQNYRFFDPQYSSLYSWASIGTSSYHSLQASLHHSLTHGVQFDFYYTFAKSIDLGSDAERTSVTTTSTATAYGEVINSFNPKQNRGVSDFDVRHAITANWMVNLPFGRGTRFGSNVNHIVDLLIGHWTMPGLVHWTSGLPFSSVDGLGWGTNWDYQSWNVATGPIESGGHHLDSGGQPNAFKDQAAALANLRAPYPGEAGQRNNYRGDGYFSIDSGLYKVIPTREGQSLKLAWEVMNVTNSVRFDPFTVTNDPFGSASSYGRYSSLLTQPRRMQLSMRYSF